MIVLVVVAIAVIYLVASHFFWKAQSWPEGGMRPPTYQGHRGYWKGGAQENTMASFKAAKERGLQMIEMDVRLSSDKQVVVFHDDDLKRIGHVDQKVESLTASELAKLADIPTLEEVLLSKEIPQFLNIELKTGKAFESELEVAVAMLIKKHQAQKRILFSSFNPLAIYRLSKLLPEVPRALLATREKDPANRFYLKLLLLAPYVNLNVLHLDHNYVSLEELEHFRRRKIPVAFWTVNEAEKARELLDHGALSIISDTLH